MLIYSEETKCNYLTQLEPHFATNTPCCKCNKKEKFECETDSLLRINCSSDSNACSHLNSICKSIHIRHNEVIGTDHQWCAQNYGLKEEITKSKICEEKCTVNVRTVPYCKSLKGGNTSHFVPTTCEPEMNAGRCIEACTDRQDHRHAQMMELEECENTRVESIEWNFIQVLLKCLNYIHIQ